MIHSFGKRFFAGLAGMVLASGLAYGQEAESGAGQPAAMATESTATDSTIGEAAAVDQAQVEETDMASEVTMEIEEPAPWATLGCEIGFNLTEGNASTRDLMSACKSEKKISIVQLTASGGYNYGVARFGVPRGAFILNRNNWFAQLREDIFVDEAERTYVFGLENFNGDQLAGLQWAFLGQVGAGYSYVKTEKQVHSVEAGFEINYQRFTIAQAGGNDEARYAAFISLLGQGLISESASFEYQLTWTPNINEFTAPLPDGSGTMVKDFRLLGIAGLKFVLTNRISFATRVESLYDNQPNLIAAVDQAGAEIVGVSRMARNWDTTWTNLLIVSIF